MNPDQFLDLLRSLAGQAGGVNQAGQAVNSAMGVGPGGPPLPTQAPPPSRVGQFAMPGLMPGGGMGLINMMPQGRMGLMDMLGGGGDQAAPPPVPTQAPAQPPATTGGYILSPAEREAMFQRMRMNEQTINPLTPMIDGRMNSRSGAF